MMVAMFNFSKLGKVKHTIIWVIVNFALGKSMTQLVLETCIDCTSLDFFFVKVCFLFKYLFNVTCSRSTIENIFYHSSPLLSLHDEFKYNFVYIVILCGLKILSSSLWQNKWLLSAISCCKEFYFRKWWGLWSAFSFLFFPAFDNGSVRSRFY